MNWEIHKGNTIDWFQLFGVRNILCFGSSICSKGWSIVFIYMEYSPTELQRMDMDSDLVLRIYMWYILLVWYEASPLTLCHFLFLCFSWLSSLCSTSCVFKKPMLADSPAIDKFSQLQGRQTMFMALLFILFKLWHVAVLYVQVALWLIAHLRLANHAECPENTRLLENHTDLITQS